MGSNNPAVLTILSLCDPKYYRAFAVISKQKGFLARSCSGCQWVSSVCCKPAVSAICFVTLSHIDMLCLVSSCRGPRCRRLCNRWVPDTLLFAVLVPLSHSYVVSAWCHHVGAQGAVVSASGGCPFLCFFLCWSLSHCYVVSGVIV